VRLSDAQQPATVLDHPASRRSSASFAICELEDIELIRVGERVTCTAAAVCGDFGVAVGGRAEQQLKLPAGLSLCDDRPVAQRAAW
jgi:hypothetical protein